MKKQYILPLSFVAAAIVASCTYVSQGVVTSADRSAVALPKDHFGDTTEKIVYLDQNWDRWDSLWFYNTTQGSDFLPMQRRFLLD